MSDTNFVTVHEAAAETKVPRTTVYRWIASKAVSSHRNGKMVLVALEDVRRAAAARCTPDVPEITGTPPGNGTDGGNVGQPMNRQPQMPGAGAPAVGSWLSAFCFRRDGSPQPGWGSPSE